VYDKIVVVVASWCGSSSRRYLYLVPNILEECVVTNGVTGNPESQIFAFFLFSFPPKDVLKMVQGLASNMKNTLFFTKVSLVYVIEQGDV
jgi:hypothetical protein